MRLIRALTLAVVLVTSLAWPLRVHAVTYALTDLGTLPGGDISDAFGVNASAQVVGQSNFASGSSIVHAFLYTGGAMTDLGTLGGSASFAAGINAAGQVVGTAQTAGGVSHAFLYSGGVMTDLGTLGSASFATGINAAGQVAGYSDNALSFRHAFLYSGGVMTELGTFGGETSLGWGINATGQMAGSANLPNDVTAHAFLYSGGVMSDLGTLGGQFSEALGINASGQVVGYSDINAAGAQHGFVYGGGVMTDLGTLGGTVSLASGINAAGQVVGSATLPGDAIRHAFLATPATGAGDNHPFRASSFLLWFVRSNSQCTSPGNITHNAPLPFGACVPTSASPTGPSFGPFGYCWTQGTVLPNGVAPATDIRLKVVCADIHDNDDGGGGLATRFHGMLTLTPTLRITDHFCNGAPNTPCTMVDIPFPIPLPCGIAASPPLGAGVCKTKAVVGSYITANYVLAGSVGPGRHASIGVSNLRIFKGGNPVFEAGLWAR